MKRLLSVWLVAAVAAAALFAGGVRAEGCEGTATACSNFGANATTCAEQAGCEWSTVFGSCRGTPDACGDFSLRSACEEQAGCTWNDSPSGMSMAVIIGIVAAGAVVVIMAAVLAFVFFARARKRAAFSASDNPLFMETI